LHAGVAVRVGVFLLLLLQLAGDSRRFFAAAQAQNGSSQGTVAGDYVGSKSCASCHRSVYDSFLRTDMGRSMAPVTPAILAKLPPQAEVFNAGQNRHFSVSVERGKLYQSEWETDPDGNDIFRQTEPIEWIIGSGANAMGGIVRKGDRLFEAPLTYYGKTRAWGLSPGYEEVDRGFSRPIEAACIVCHSARPNPVNNVTGQFRNPPFYELAIGCETCHGPGAAHVREMSTGKGHASAENIAIVNPAKLRPWLADNICMSCHQNGDARVLQPGKKFQDFRPGQPLDRTLAILMVPPTREFPPDSDHVQHYFSMRLSKCYLSSNAKLSCITCHNPHVQPTRAEAAAYFRQKCLSCHMSKSCTAPVSTREKTEPADDCISCHLPKRDIVGISHSSLTNHRILRSADEPFPEVTFQLTTTALPDLVHIDAIPGEADARPAPLTLLQAYGLLGVDHRAYMQRYFAAAKELEASEPNNSTVLEALAAGALQEKTAETDAKAMDYLARAIEQGSTSAWDFEQVGTHLLRAQKFSEALNCLQKGVERAPYDAKLYALLAASYAALNRPQDSAATLHQALQRFPQLDFLRGLLNNVEQQPSPGSQESQQR
jgi:hypothetical protein